MLLQDQIKKNNRKTVFLFFNYIIILCLIGWFIGYLTGIDYYGVLFAFIIAVIYCLILIFSSKKMLLKMTNAVPLDKNQYAYVWNTVEGLSYSAGIPIPEIYIIDSQAPNAFATGYNPANAAIGITRGLLEIANREELEGVLAHEMSHIMNHDIRTATVAIALGATIIFLGRLMFRFGLGMGRGGNRRRKKNDGAIVGIVFAAFGLIIMIISPLITALIQSAISRRREYQADASAVKLAGSPDGLASALEKISKIAISKDDMKVLGNKEVMGIYINNPLARKNSWFDTHPPIEKRIKILREML